MKLARLLLIFCWALSLAAVAQEKQPASKPKANAEKQKKEAKPGMPAMKPAPEMQKLSKMLAGTYTTKETHEPSPFMPQGGAGTGEAKFFPGPGGFSLIETYASKSGPMGAKFRGHGVIWYDAKAGGYRSLWCDSMSPACEVGGITKWEGDKLTGTSESELMAEMMGGKKVTYKESMSGFSPEGFRMDMEMSTEGGPMKHVMTIEYTRAQASAAKPAAEKETQK